MCARFNETITRTPQNTERSKTEMKIKFALFAGIAYSSDRLITDEANCCQEIKVKNRNPNKENPLTSFLGTLGPVENWTTFEEVSKFKNY